MTDVSLDRELPVGSIGRHANGWWGMMTLISTEGALFAYLLFSYYYFAVQHGRQWLPTELPHFRISAPDTLILLLSSVVVWRGERLLRRGGNVIHVAFYLAGGAILGVVFMVLQYIEWENKKFSIATNSYGSLYFTITGFHMMHVLMGVLILGTLTIWTALGYFDARRSAPVSIGAIYWHFVDAVWITLFFTFYVTPRLNLG